MSGFEYKKYITVIEVNPRPIVTLDDEKLKVEYGNDFTAICVSLLLLDNAIKGLQTEGKTSLKKNLKLTLRKLQLNWRSRKLGIKDFKADSLLEAVYERRKQLQN